MFKSLKAKLAAIFIVVVAISILSVSGIVTYDANKLIKESAESSAQQNVEIAVENIQSFLAEHGSIGTVLVESKTVKELNRAEFESQIFGILSKRPSLMYITVASEKTGEMFGAESVDGVIKPWEATYDPRTTDWYNFIKEQGELCFSPAFKSSNGKYIVTAGTPFFDENNQFAGVVTVDISLDSIMKFVSELKFGETGYAFLLDSNGVFIGHPSKELIGKNATESKGKAGQVCKDMVAGKAGTEIANFEGNDQYVFYAPIPLANWSVAVTIGTEEVNAPVNKLIKTVLGIGVVALIITVLVSLGFANKIAKPIIEVKNQLMDMAQGEGDLTKRLKATSNDEVGELTLWFNQFIDKLGSIIYQVQNTSKAVKTTSGELSMNSMESTRATEQVAAAIEQIAKGATEQTTEIGNTVEVVSESNVAINQMAAGAQEQNENVISTTEMVTEMVDKIDKMIKDMDSVRKAAEDNKSVAEQGKEEVNNTIEGMISVKDTAKESANKINQLGEQSKMIGDIIQVIDDIAEQTNLLALNAAIEAARAGEHGKGFAVVADEVRKLAERSSQATKEIGGLINGIQTGVDAAVSAIEVNAQEVEKGVSMAERAGEALTNILAGIKITDGSVQQVMEVIDVIHSNSKEVLAAINNVMKITEQNSAATQQMSASSEHVNSLMGSISSISEETAASAEEVSASTEELNASIEEMSASSDSLAKMAEELDELVGQFKVRTE